MIPNVTISLLFQRLCTNLGLFVHVNGIEGRPNQNKKMLLLGDCNHWLKEIKDESIDLIVTDPPYGIEFMGKDWDKALVPTETWKECYRVLKPGKLAFVMCSPRQDVLSRMIVNLQDAGFRTNYTSIYWTFASGFPKAANVSKLIDKRNGIEVGGVGERTKKDYGMKNRCPNCGKPFYSGSPCRCPRANDKPATEEAKKMEGAYVGFQPKPAVEIILVVSKGKTLTWLDQCRIPYNKETDTQPRIRDGKNCKREAYRNNVYGNFAGIDMPYFDEKGRFPANLLVSDDVLNDGKIRTSNDHFKLMKGKPFDPTKGWNNHHMINNSERIYNDSGSYSRYFSLDAWWNKTFPFLIVPKASKSERNDGLDSIQPVKVNDGRNTPIDNPFQRGETLRTNSHPTVKPLKLMSYLITMGSREGDLVLDPFCGSGTVCIAAHQLHRKWLGIEMNPEYAEIIKKRLADPLAQLKLSVFE